MRNIDRKSLPEMPSTYNGLVSDVHARFPGADGRRLFGLMYAALVAELAAHDEKKHRRQGLFAKKSSDVLYEAAALCHPYYCEDVPELTKKFGALLCIQPKDEEFFAYIGWGEGDASTDNCVRQVDLMLRRLRQEEAKAARKDDRPSGNSANSQPFRASIRGFVGKLWAPRNED